MKKNLLLFAATAALFSSCSNDEIIENQPQSAIGFDNFVSKTTRATDATTSNLMRMNVYGYISDATPAKIFDGTLVSRSDASEWTYNPIQYWIADKKYLFTALSSPVTEGNQQYTYNWAETLPDENAEFYGTGTISFDNGKASGNEDLVYAYATKTTPATISANPGKVEFAFKHALSRVKFTFMNKMGSDAYIIKVYNLTINNAISNADLVLGEESPQWSNHVNTTQLTLRSGYFTPTSQTAAHNANVASGTKFIIPGISTLKISFDVDLIVNGSTIATYHHIDQLLPETAFQNGHSYNFVAAITPQNIDPDNEMFPIEFNVVDVEGWVEDPDITVTLPEKEPGA